MAMGSGGGEGGLSSEINVTPMIDVLLVLLIIFMITLPLGRREFDVQVPPEQQTKSKSQSSAQIVLELTTDGGYALNKQAIPFTQLDAKLHEIYDPRPVKLLFIKAAPNRRYGEVVQAMDIAHGAGVQVIGFTPAGRVSAGRPAPRTRSSRGPSARARTATPGSMSLDTPGSSCSSSGSTRSARASCTSVSFRADSD